MTASDAARLHAINDQAIAILKLGIPLDLGFGGDPIECLANINARLQAGLAEGATDDSSLQLFQDDRWPDGYRKLAAMWLATDNTAAIFESLIRREQHRRATVLPLRRAALQPLSIAVMVFLGVVYYCVVVVPRLQDQYAQVNATPSVYTSVLIGLKNTLPFWLIGFPITLGLVYFGWRNAASRLLFQRLSGGRELGKWNDAESRTRSLAVLLESDVRADKAIELAGPIPEPGLASTIARSPDAKPSSKAESLRRLSHFYRFLARDRRESLFTKFPALVGLLLAGVILLIYGLVVFVPWIEVLRGIGRENVRGM